jgi:hypothetical protein
MAIIAFLLNYMDFASMNNMWNNIGCCGFCPNEVPLGMDLILNDEKEEDQDQDDDWRERGQGECK